MLFDPDEREEAMEIQRYIIKQDPISLPEMVPYTQGAYCLYSDHLKEKDAIISTRTEVAHQLQDALSVRDRQIATLTAERDRLKEALKEIINLGHGEGKHIEGEIAQVALAGEE